MRIILILCLISCITAVEKITVMPIEAQKILNILDTRVADLQRQAAKDLKQVQDAQTKQGKLEEALLVRDAVNELDKLASSVTDNLGLVQAPEKLVIGKWRWNGGSVYVTLQSKGIASTSTNVNGVWTVNNNNQLMISWNNGYVDILSLPEKDEMLGVTKGGGQIKAVRVVELKP